MKLKVQGQALSVDGGGIISEGAVEFASFVLECDESWNGFEKTVRFRHTSSRDVYDVAGVKTNAVYYIPAEVLVKGTVFVSVLGVFGGMHISTTEPASFFVEGTLDGGKTPKVTENAYAQYVREVISYTDEAKEAKEKALFSQNVCEELAGLASVYEDKCEESAKACSDFAAFCERVSESAGGAENSMQKALETVKDSINTLLDKNSALSIAEAERRNSESIRESTESLRRASESERTKKEDERVFAEAERVFSEKARIVADEEREERLRSVEDKVEGFENSLFKTSGAIYGKKTASKLLITDADSKTPVRFSLRGKTSLSTIPSRTSAAEIMGVGEKGEVSIVHNGKNLIPFPYSMGTFHEKNGVSFTAHNDGSVTARGTSEGVRVIAELTPENFILPAGEYIVSGGSLNCIVCVYDEDINEYIARSYGDDTEFSLPKDTHIRVRVYVFLNRSVGEVTVYPMLRHAHTSDLREMYFKNIYTIIPFAPLYEVKGIDGEIYDEIVLCEKGNVARHIFRLASYTLTGYESVELFEEGERFNTFRIDCGNEFVSARVFGRDLFQNMGISSHFAYGDTLDEESVWVCDNSIYIKLDKNEFKTPDNVIVFLRAAVYDGTPVRLVYPRAVEETEEYDGEKIASLNFEVNEFSASEGNIEVSYIRNLNTAWETIIDTLVSLDARLSLLEV